MGGSAFLPGHVRWPAAGALFPFGFQKGFQRQGQLGCVDACLCVEAVRAFEGLVHEPWLLACLPVPTEPSVCTRGHLSLRGSETISREHSHVH